MLIGRVIELVSRVSTNLFSTKFEYIVSQDLKGGKRVFIQIMYTTKCTKEGADTTWKGRKWYLSEHMTDDEVIKTCFVAFKSAVEHEIMEAFKVDDIILFNPHVSYEALLRVSNEEIRRS